MTNCLKTVILILLFPGMACLSAQDSEIPLSPVLDLVTVDPVTGHSSLEWKPGGSPDVAGYVIYLYRNAEGYAIDTIYQPDQRTYTYTGSNAAYYSESYVIAAIDSSDNVSPLSNFLNTVFLRGRLDTCSHSIVLTWNKYHPKESTVTEYNIYSSPDGAEYSLDGSVSGSDTIYSIDEFTSYSRYCFYIEASLSDGSSSTSNSFCINTSLPVPPSWINADYASYTSEGFVELSFTIDPASEYKRYRIERTKDSLNMPLIIYETHEQAHSITYTDRETPEGVNYYRLAALNSCEEPVVYSNYASTINLNVNADDNTVYLSWNRYYNWEGGIASQSLLRDNSGQFEEIAVLSAADTSYTDNISDFIYDTAQKNICYRLIAREGSNQYTGNASSKSEIKCTEQAVKIFVPNAFTPDNNMLNDVFLPILSFTPPAYRLIIKNRAGISLFETNDHLEGWDGRYRGKALPQDVYIWFIRAETPGGETISRSGTLTIIFN